MWVVLTPTHAHSEHTYQLVLAYIYCGWKSAIFLEIFVGRCSPRRIKCLLRNQCCKQTIKHNTTSASPTPRPFNSRKQMLGRSHAYQLAAPTLPHAHTNSPVVSGLLEFHRNSPLWADLALPHGLASCHSVDSSPAILVFREQNVINDACVSLPS